MLACAIALDARFPRRLGLDMPRNIISNKKMEESHA